MPRISIEIDKEMFKQLEKRAKRNFMSVRELVEDVVRRSMVSYKTGGREKFPEKIDDKLVALFSRKKRGKKK